MRLLVTGASGLLGTVAVLDRCETDDIVALHRAPFHVPGVTAEVVDLTDPDAVARVFDRAGPDVVLHTAAVASIDACERDPSWPGGSTSTRPRTVARLAAARRRPAGARLDGRGLRRHRRSVPRGATSRTR